jgi:hypothetical protein
MAINQDELRNRVKEINADGDFLTQLNKDVLVNQSKNTFESARDSTKAAGEATAIRAAATAATKLFEGIKKNSDNASNATAA